MKAVALDYLFAHHHSSFWAFIEKLFSHRRRVSKTEVERHLQSKNSYDFFGNVEFFENDGELEGYLRSFREE